MSALVPASGRKLLSYDFFTGSLIFKTPLHIGSADSSAHTDSPLSRDATGRIYVPGTSIAGPLRARAEELFCDGGSAPFVRELFGYQQERNGKHEGRSSRLWLEDAYPTDDADWASVRDGVALHRGLGSALPGAKYDFEITPRDMEFDLRMRLVLRNGDPCRELRYIVLTLLDELCRGHIKIGGHKSRGLGRCRYALQWHRLDFSKPEQLCCYLVHKDPRQCPSIPFALPELPASLTKALDRTLRVKLVLSVREQPFLIKDGKGDGDHDAEFYSIPCRDGSMIDCTPGSSLKGVFRARAEKILRTLGRNACCAVGEGSCGHRLKEAIERGEHGPNDYEPIHRRSCPVCRLFGSGYLASRIVFDDAFFLSTPSPPLHKKKHENVAINRFTGGAADGKLFDAYPVVQGSLESCFELRNPTDLEKMLVLMILRDLKDGFPQLAFGYGKSKGYGRLLCTGLSFNGNPLADDPATWADAAGVSPEARQEWWQSDDNPR